MEHDSPEPTAAPSSSNLPAAAGSSSGPHQSTTLMGCRHDGWTGDKMAIFCEALADTAVVAEACEQARMGISGAYALRRRNTFFAAAWDAALTIARERLADTLLARSIEGNVEQIWRDGELVGERHVIDNRLGLAILRRLDRLAETGSPLHNLSPISVRPERSRGAPAPSPMFDWDQALDALRTGDPDAIATALALIKSNEVEEVEDPPIRPGEGDNEPKFLDLTDRCWRDGIDNNWLTDFPPPRRFKGYESCDYGDPDEDYERVCTPAEVAILEADIAAARAAERAEDEELRDAWFAMLDGELEDADEDRSWTGHGVSLRWANPGNRVPPEPLIECGKSPPATWRVKMVLDPTNASKFRTWIKDAQPEDLVSIAPLLFSRIGTLDQSQQDRFIKEVHSDPQAKRVFEKMKSYAQ